MEYPNLFQPGRIGTVSVRNRLVMAPMGTNFATESGAVTDQLVEYYGARAAGGTGLIFTGVAAVDHPEAAAIARQLHIDADRYVPGLSRLTRRIHDHGAACFLQLHHAGGMAKASPEADWQPVVPSRVDGGYSARDPRVLETDEIATIAEQFVAGAKRAQRAGFDGVELHGAHGYLIEQFLSPRTNKRADRYGGSLDARLRFPVELIHGIREACGREFALSFRLSADEFVEDGYGVDTACTMAERLVDAGLDVLNVTAGTYGSAPQTLEPMRFEEGWRSYLAAEMRDVVDVPVIAVGVIRQPETAEDLLASGAADFVALGRGHISDPSFAEKAREGRAADINRCIGCNIGCLGDGIFADRTLGCTVNPAVGREREFATMEPAPSRQAVLVAGGGPAGMQAAIHAADRGHSVTLCEQADHLGGQLPLASQPPGKSKIRWYLENLERELTRRDVRIELETKVDTALVDNRSPDVIICATGARPREPDIPGIDHEHVAQAWEVLSETRRVETGPVAVIGGGDVGCDVAAFLADAGHEVTILEQATQLAPDKERISRIDMLGRFEQFETIRWETGAEVEEISASSVHCAVDGSGMGIPASTVVLAVGHVPDNSLATALAGLEQEVYLVGDVRDSRDIYRATLEGTEAALSIGSPWKTFSPEP